MLTRKQYDLLMFVHGRVQETGVPPSFDEMKEALDLKSKSGIHRLITALEERGYIRRLPHRARALEVLKLPENIAQERPQRPQGGAGGGAGAGAGAPHLSLVSSDGETPPAARMRTPAQPQASEPPSSRMVPVVGRIAAGVPIEAVQNALNQVEAPASMLSAAGEHFALEVKGESMVDAGIHEGDLVVIRKQETASNGDIVVALVDGEDATLKRLLRRGGRVALEAANPEFETRVYPADRVAIQGRLVGLIRTY